jgi:glucose dehydrogenase
VTATTKSATSQTASAFGVARIVRNATLLCLSSALSVATLSAHAQGTGARDPFDFRAWNQYLGGADSSQYSALDQINKSNVARLEVAWEFRTEQNYQFNPIVIDGVMVLQARGRSLIAVDARSGEEIWTRPHDGAIGARGINYWESADGADRRLLYLHQGHLTAIDARTGEPVRSFGTDGRVDLREGMDRDTAGLRPLQTSNPGRIFEDLMIVSLPAGAFDFASTSGDVHAYDVRSGELRWTFRSVPRPGEYGADTWPEEGLELFGGAHNWSESTVDVERGIFYAGFGAPRYDFYGANRPGENLFTQSLVALDARTGERLWHYQTIQHDIWDYDIPQAPKLLTVRHDGRDVDVVVQATKMGFVFVFDRDSGEPLWPIEHREVPQSDAPGEQTWPTQPFPTMPPPFARQSFTEADINPYISEEDQERVRELLRTHRNEGLYTPPALDGSIMMPGHNGGANWGSSSVDPVNGRFYVVSKELPTRVALIPPAEGAQQSVVPNAGPDFVPYRSPVDFMLMSNGLSAIGPPWSQITAYDLNTGQIIWQKPHGGVMGLPEGTGSQAPRGGVVTTAGGLVFAGTSSDRKMRAYDADTGEVLWEYDLPAATEGVPAVYEVDGRQYLAIAVGGNGMFAPNLDFPAPGPGRYMVFALPGEAVAQR